MGSLFDKVTGVHAPGMKENIMFKEKSMFALRSRLVGRQSVETYTGSNLNEV